MGVLVSIQYKYGIQDDKNFKEQLLCISSLGIVTKTQLNQRESLIKVDAATDNSETNISRTTLMPLSVTQRELNV